MKIEKTLYIVGGTLGGLVLTYFGYSLWKANKNKELAETGKRIGGKEGTGNNDENTQSSDDKKQSRDSFPLRVSSFGYRVSLLQSALNKLGASLTVDGRFGEKTYDAIWDYGNLPWYVWKQTLFSRLNTLSKQSYNEILAEATKQGWKKEQAKGIAGETWKEFVQNGDDWVYSNLRM